MRYLPACLQSIPMHHLPVRRFVIQLGRVEYFVDYGLPELAPAGVFVAVIVRPD